MRIYPETDSSRIPIFVSTSIGHYVKIYIHVHVCTCTCDVLFTLKDWPSSFENPLHQFKER